MAHLNNQYWQQIRLDLIRVTEHLADRSIGRVLVSAMDRLVERNITLERQIESLETRVTKLEQEIKNNNDDDD